MSATVKLFWKFDSSNNVIKSFLTMTKHPLSWLILQLDSLREQYTEISSSLTVLSTWTSRGEGCVLLCGAHYGSDVWSLMHLVEMCACYAPGVRQGPTGLEC